MSHGEPQGQGVARPPERGSPASRDCCWDRFTAKGPLSANTTMSREVTVIAAYFLAHRVRRAPDVALMDRSQERMTAMDPQLFDRVARLLSRPRSRRTTWQVLLSLALSGGAALRADRGARSAPARACDREHPCPEACCGTTCCPGRCFEHPDPQAAERFYCCMEPTHVICGNPKAANPDEQQVCCPKGGRNPCACAEGGLIAGSYRRR
jgi:hypothetical protein